MWAHVGACGQYRGDPHALTGTATGSMWVHVTLHGQVAHMQPQVREDGNGLLLLNWSQGHQTNH